MPPSAVDALSEAQRRALDPAVRLIDAGPGSGKTRTVVSRYLREAAEGDSGVALISFTNAAVDEARKRASRAQHLLHAPHFVGTIDAFLHRFVVTPHAVATLGRAPTYLASWEDLPDHHRSKRVRVKDVPGIGIRLSSFAPHNREIVLMASSLDRHEELYLAAVEAEGRRVELVGLARSSIRAYAKAGVYDSSAARAIAANVIQGQKGPRVLRLLARRFGLLLVDEAQDCDEHEMAVLELLGKLTSVVLVADPDQAIFEFRGGRPEIFLAYRDSQAAGACASLHVCYRSTTAICALVSALRSAGRAQITAADSGACPPVLIAAGNKTQQREKFLSALDRYGVDVANAIVLAHGRGLAQGVAGGPAPVSTRAAGNRLAHARSVLSDDESTWRERLDAISDVEKVLLELIEWPSADVRTTSRTAQLQEIGRDSVWLRRTAGALMQALVGITEPRAFGEVARTAIAIAYHGVALPHAKLHTRVRRPEDGLMRSRAESGRIAHDTVHGRKGQEFEAVLLALPRARSSGDVLTDWANNTNTEARRVMYVGASRAKRMIALGAEPATATRLCELLDRHGVPYERQ